MRRLDRSYGSPRSLRRLELGHDRLGEGVADDREVRDAATLDRRQQFGGIEAARPEGDDGAGGAHHTPAGDGRRAVHQAARRAGGGSARARSWMTRAAAATSSSVRGTRETEPLEGRRTGSDERAVGPHDALGHAGGAAGVEEPQVVERPLDAGSGC